MSKQAFFVEVSDTFGGEANYSWVNRYLVTATTIRGAVWKLSRETGLKWRVSYDIQWFARYDAVGCCMCCFVHEEVCEETPRNCKVL